MSNKEAYVYLDFQERLDNSQFNYDVFFKMVNLDSKPYVQIGNSVFEGKYEDCMGSKVFFMEDDEYTDDDNVFTKRSSVIHLKYLAKTAKVLRLHRKQVPIYAEPKIVETNQRMDLKFTESYSTVLDKFEKGTLNIQDISYRVTPATIPDTVELEEPQKEEVAQKKAPKVVKKKLHSEEMSHKDIVREYLTMPKKIQEDQKVFEVKEEHLVKVDSPENYPVLKQLFLQELFADNVDLDIDMAGFEKYVNIEQSIANGVIPNLPVDELTPAHKSLLLSSDNFDNFTLPMKMVYIMAQLEYLERGTYNKSAKELEQVDRYGRTVKDKVQCLKQLVKDIWYHIYSNDTCR